jgi:hypothetical protein
VVTLAGLSFEGAQTYFAWDQGRRKHKDIRITHQAYHHLLTGHETSFPDLVVTYKGKPIDNIKLYHFHITNVGEVPIDKSDFELGPIIDFSNPTVIDAKITRLEPTDVQATALTSPDKVGVRLEGEFRVNEDIAVDILFSGDPGEFKNRYRIKGGESGISP